MAKEGYQPPNEVDTSNGEYASQGIPMTEDVEKTKEFVPSKGLTTFEFQQLLEKWGRNELEDKKKSKVGSYILAFSPSCFSSLGSISC
jgi:hypothetical protein